MHPALHIPEMVELVCSHVCPQDPDRPWPGSVRRRDLSALARTSKIFQEPALNALWAIQLTFANVLRCMPDDLWNRPPMERGVLSLDITRPITPADWERPLFYMSRVKLLHCGIDSTPSAALFAALSACLPTETFFPNLHRLELPSYHPPYLRALLTPYTTSLWFSIFSETDLAEIPTLVHRCGHLTSVQISHLSPPQSYAQIRTSISLFVRGLTHIEKLQIFSLDELAFEHLAGLTCLKSLIVDNPEDVNPFALSPSLSEMPVFSALRSVRLQTPSTEQAVAFIAALSNSPLAEASIAVISSAAITAMPTLCSAIQEMWPTGSLRSLDITIVPRINGAEPVVSASRLSSIKTSALQRLLCFRNLEIVRLHVDGGWDIDDEMVGQMARAWPNARILALRPIDAFNKFARRVSLAALRALSLHCPKLTSLDLDVNASFVPTLHVAPDNEDAHPQPQTALTILWIGYAPISDPRAVADFLFAIFPALSLMQTNTSWTRADGEFAIASARWFAVQRMLAQKRLASPVEDSDPSPSGVEDEDWFTLFSN
ncbi:hypothetical protein B0H17DRAFT_1060924 [Mycena rosella]|uniref:F-box domain-containing protein n=1 Tax=Mycena rosella TaxID=1033263 RepID=A0AAD7GFT9_MYCRO|nr:hypothetical protein B0H17DRAFT_1060924 [Mycena rosella]